MHMIPDIVTVTVDRPMGSTHPVHGALHYPINYGYVKGILAPDGEDQDAYIIGIDRPVPAFTGRLIAIIHRANDIEKKWVVAPDHILFDINQIRALVQFQERYFASTISMIPHHTEHNNDR